MEIKVNELNENEIAEMIYEKINVYWGMFPNIWKYTTKDEIASEVAIDLYRPRKSDGIPHIVHYNMEMEEKGKNNLKGLIGLFVYNNLRAEARSVHSTGIRNVEGRRNVYSAISLETPFGDEDGMVLGDTVSDERENVSRSVDYVMLYDSLPDKLVEDVYYKVGETYLQVSYKSLLQKILDGYKVANIAETLYKKTSSGSFCEFDGLSRLLREMKSEMKKFLQSEYDYTEEKFKGGCNIL